MTAIINFISFLVFIYLVLYAIYLLNINIKAFYAKDFLAENEPENYSKDEIKENKLCVVIFANSKTKKLEPLLRALNAQSYDREKYSVHVIFAKDSNSIYYTPDCIAGAQIHSIENSEYFKKDKALNLFLEKLMADLKFDAFVFLGADRFVSPDYLKTVNIALNKIDTGVITGKTTIVANGEDIKAKIAQARQEYKNNTMNISKRMFELASVIDSENCVISAEIMEKTGRVCFENKDSELKFSLFLASNKIRPVYSPYIETLVEVRDYNPASAGVKTRFSLFKYYLPLLINKPLYFVEFVLSLIMPNVVICILLYLFLMYTSFKFIFSIGLKGIMALGIFYLFVWAVGLIASKMRPLKICAFFLYPIYSLAFNLKNLSKDFSKCAMTRAINEDKNIKSVTMDAVVTDGKKNVLCKMDIMTEEGMRRVILRFRKKRVISDESIRMYDAVENISKRIKNHGFTLKICQNCQYFKIVQDGTVDLLQGVCSVNGTNPDDLLDTLVWNHCGCFTLKEETNAMDDIKKRDN